MLWPCPCRMAALWDWQEMSHPSWTACPSWAAGHRAVAAAPPSDDELQDLCGFTPTSRFRGRLEED